jgi:hypothetical protein
MKCKDLLPDAIPAIDVDSSKSRTERNCHVKACAEALEQLQVVRGWATDHTSYGTLLASRLL